jgi:predicted ester cyclase
MPPSCAPSGLQNTPTFEGWYGRPARFTVWGMTSTDANKQIVEEFITALFTDGDLTAVDRYLDPGFVNHDPPMPGAPDGPDGMRQAGEVFRRAFPDWRSEVQQLIAEGDLVAENFTARGTHRAPLMGETPTGREVVLRGVNIFRIADGKIVERWGRLDDLGLLQQLGLAPRPSASATTS